MQHRFTISEAIELHVIDRQAQRFTADTLRFYRGRLRLFSHWCNSAGIIHIDDRSFCTYLAEVTVRCDADELYGSPEAWQGVTWGLVEGAKDTGFFSAPYLHS